MPGLPELAQALLDPKAYPEPSPSVSLIQTQMSMVFLAGDFAYKVKKPVNLGYLDYTTLEKRLFFCRRETELNSRLCPSAYLGVVPITDEGGRIQVDGKGTVIEYAVKMRNLPHEAMLDFLLEKNSVTPEMIRNVSRTMAEFHRKAETSPEISRYGSLDVIRLDVDENFSQTDGKAGLTLTMDAYERIKAYTYGFLQARASLFQKRVNEGRIRDCHGDLHAEHVCFCEPGNICIYDCIEFNDRFRYCDVASEIAFLAMDLDRFGRHDLSNVFVDSYVSFCGDKDLLKVLNFYKCYRAYVRGKVEGFKLDSPLMTEEGKSRALASAKKYFKLAEKYVG